MPTTIEVKNDLAVGKAITIDGVEREVKCVSFTAALSENYSFIEGVFIGLDHVIDRDKDLELDMVENIDPKDIKKYIDRKSCRGRDKEIYQALLNAGFE